jgi:hypothetical protein
VCRAARLSVSRPFGGYGAAVGDITDAQLDQVAAAQLVIAGEVEQGLVAQPVGQLQSDPDRPDLAHFSGGFGPVSLPLFQGVRDERVSAVLVSSAMVCLLGNSPGVRMVAGGDRRAPVDPALTFPLFCQLPRRAFAQRVDTAGTSAPRRP